MEYFYEKHVQDCIDSMEYSLKAYEKVLVSTLAKNKTLTLNERYRKYIGDEIRNNMQSNISRFVSAQVPKSLSIKDKRNIALAEFCQELIK